MQISNSIPEFDYIDLKIFPFIEFKTLDSLKLVNNKGKINCNLHQQSIEWKIDSNDLNNNNKLS